MSASIEYASLLLSVTFILSGFNRILSAIPDKKKNYSTDKTILLVCHAIIVFKVICMFILKFKIIVLHFPICNICSHYFL